jgi:hypothetical protein
MLGFLFMGGYLIIQSSQARYARHSRDVTGVSARELECHSAKKPMIFCQKPHRQAGIFLLD